MKDGNEVKREHENADWCIHNQYGQGSLFKRFVNMIRSRAWKYAKAYGMDYDDVEAEGFTIYCICLEKFNGKLASFSTYLFNNLNGRLNDYCERYVNQTYRVNLETDILSKTETIIGYELGVNGVPVDALKEPTCVASTPADYSETRDRFLDFAQDWLTPFAFGVLKYLVDRGFDAGSERKPTVKKVAEVLSMDNGSIQNAFDEIKGFWQCKGHDFFCQAT